jgi:hypothetical protein
LMDWATLSGERLNGPKKTIGRLNTTGRNPEILAIAVS